GWTKGRGRVYKRLCRSCGRSGAFGPKNPRHVACTSARVSLARSDSMHILGQIIFGLFVGIIAKLIMPGRDPGGMIVTALIGMAGALIGTFIGRVLWGDANYSAGWIMSIAGSVILLWLYRIFAGRSRAAI